MEWIQYVDHLQTTVAELIGVDLLLAGPATLTLGVLMHAGFHEEAGGWCNWLLVAVAGSPDDLYNCQAGGWYPQREI